MSTNKAKPAALAKPAKIGIWGGSFDPVHGGHLQMATETRAQLALDEMVMLPAGDPPHRGGVIEAHHRLAMLQAAVGDTQQLTVDTREIERQGASFSVLTCREYRHMYPDTALYWCMGSDAFAHFDTWYAWQEILSLVNIAVIARPDAPIDATSSIWQNIGSVYSTVPTNSKAGSVVCLNLSAVPVSSTQVRAALRAGQPIKNRAHAALPEPVWQYIQHHKLYINDSKPN